VSTVDDRRAAYRRDHRKPSPSDDQPRDSVYSFEDLAGDPALRPTEDPRGQTPPPGGNGHRDVLVLAVADP